VKGVVAGEARGWYRLGDGTFQSDRFAETPLSGTALRALAADAGQELTYTCVPPGEGQRIGVDRDGDGFFDRDELDAGSDPADPASIPSGGTTSTSTTTTTSTTTMTIPAPPPGPSKCTSHKLGLAGKNALAKARCYSKAVAKGAAVDPDCTAKADGTLETLWAKFEIVPNDCLGTGDVGTAEFYVNTALNVLHTILIPSQAASRCTSRKILLAGKKVRARVKCYATAVAKGHAVDGDCLQKAGDKLLAGLVKLEVPGNDCLTSGDEFLIQNGTDTFVGFLVNALEP